MKIYMYAIEGDFFGRPFVAKDKKQADEMMEKEVKMYVDNFTKSINEIKSELKDREKGFKDFIKRSKKGIDVLKLEISQEEKERRLKELNIAEDKFTNMVKESHILDSIAASEDTWKDYEKGKLETINEAEKEVAKLKNGKRTCFVVNEV